MKVCMHTLQKMKWSMHSENYYSHKNSYYFYINRNVG
jgi:hypothetical protein